MLRVYNKRQGDQCDRVELSEGRVPVRKALGGWITSSLRGVTRALGFILSEPPWKFMRRVTRSDKISLDAVFKIKCVERRGAK